jgi:hypothetical protein
VSALTPVMPDTLADCQVALRATRSILWDTQRRVSQLEAELATERERWARLKASAQDAQRQGYNVDVVSFMRGVEREV